MIDLCRHAAGLTLALLMTPTAVLAQPTAQLFSVPKKARAAILARTNAQVNWKAALPAKAENPVSNISRLSPFSERLAIGTSGSRAKEFSAEIGDARLSIGMVRSKSIRIADLSSFAHPRFSSLEANLGIELPLGPQNAIGLAGNWALERRRPALVVAAHRRYKSEDRAITLSWNHDDQLRFGLSAFNTRPVGGRSKAEQLVDFAAGGSRAVHGLGFTLTSTPTRDPDRLAFGLNVRQQRVAADTLATASTSQQDARASLFFRTKF